MTAIAGLWYTDGRPATDGIDAMLAAQRMYGPDDAGRYVCNDVGLGRQLKRVLPEDTFDRQPLSGARRFRVVADVRLDNRGELIRELSLERSVSVRMSDAALLSDAYERWGEKCFEHLAGDYAFAVWDAARRSWFLARDPMGGRPLHYFRSDRCFAFASMPKGLHALADVPYAVDEDLLARALDGIPPDDSASCFRHVFKVQRGHSLVVTERHARTRPFWTPPLSVLRLKRAEEYQEALREHLDQAVHSALRGAQDVAAHLSAGLDSSAVTATAARVQARSGRRVVAFTSVPQSVAAGGERRSQIVDEGLLAAQTAALYPNIEHYLISTRGRSPLDNLDRAFDYYDQPLANLCNATWSDAINDAAGARGLRVLLTGALGNATLSYNGHELLSELLRHGRWMRLAREGFQLWRGRRIGLPRIVGLTWSASLPAPVARQLKRLLRGPGVNPHDRSLLSPMRRSELAAAAKHAWRANDRGGRDPMAGNASPSVAVRLSMMRQLDHACYNKGILAQWGLDCRDPTANLRLVEFCLATPTQQFLRGGVPSSLARTALADRLPRAVLEERRKGLQAADWHVGVTAAHARLVAEIEGLTHSPAVSRLLDIPRLRQWVHDWPTDGWERPDVDARYRSAMLRGISYAHFLHRAGDVSRATPAHRTTAQFP